MCFTMDVRWRSVSKALKCLSKMQFEIIWYINQIVRCGDDQFHKYKPKIGFTTVKKKLPLVFYDVFIYSEIYDAKKTHICICENKFVFIQLNQNCMDATTKKMVNSVYVL